MKPIPTDLAGASMDANALAGLKQQAQRSPKTALGAAASQFEAMFVQNLLKAMRETLPKDGLTDSDTMRAYTGMFDAQLAQQISTRGIGLARALERQLGAALKIDAAAGPDAGAAGANGIGATGAAGPDAGANGATGAADAAASAAAAASGLAGRAGATAHGKSLRLTFNAGGTADAATAAASPARVRRTAVPAPALADASGAGEFVRKIPEHVRNFLDTMRPHAEAAARAAGIPAAVLLAQAGLETGWGRHQPQTKDGAASHNLMGVKAGRSWNGATAKATTTEYVAGTLTRTVEKFRAYNSYTEAFADFGKLITGNARYAEALANVHDGAAFARGLQKGGYATDPHYADKLTRAIAMVNRAGTAPAAAPAQVAARTAVNRNEQA